MSPYHSGQLTAATVTPHNKLLIFYSYIWMDRGSAWWLYWPQWSSPPTIPEWMGAIWLCPPIFSLPPRPAGQPRCVIFMVEMSEGQSNHISIFRTLLVPCPLTFHLPKKINGQTHGQGQRDGLWHFGGKNCTVAAKTINIGRNEALGPFSDCPHHFNFRGYL